MNEGIHLDLDTWIVPGQIRLGFSAFKPSAWWCVCVWCLGLWGFRAPVITLALALVPGAWPAPPPLCFIHGGPGSVF